jgi:subtilisin family serine protease
VRHALIFLCCFLLWLGAPPVAYAAAPALAPPEVRAEPERYVVVTIANPQTARPGAVGGTTRGYSAAGGYRISARAAAVVRELSNRYSLKAVSEWPIEALQVHCIVFRIPENASRDSVLEALRADRQVLLAQALNEFQPATAELRYNDPYARLQENMVALDVQEAHRFSRGNGVRVAVIDTGIDTDHPDLIGRVHLIRNFVDDDAAAFRRDRHGTQVAGVIAAAAGNGIGVVGIAPEVRLLALKACWHDSSGVGRCNSFTLAQAIAEAITARAQVINLSLVGPADPLLAALVEKANAAGAIVVGAANEKSADGFPGGVAGVLPVASAEAAAVQPRWLRAPGRNLVTLVPQGHYDFASGYSLATAHISGIVALLLQQDRRLSADQVRQILQRSTTERTTPRGALRTVNACIALSQLVPKLTCSR